MVPRWPSMTISPFQCNDKLWRNHRGIELFVFLYVHKLKLFCFAREFCFSLLCEDASSYSSFHPLCKLSSLLSDNLGSRSARDCLERGYTTIQQASLAIIVLCTTAFLCPVKRARVVLKKQPTSHLLIKANSARRFWLQTAHRDSREGNMPRKRKTAARDVDRKNSRFLATILCVL